MRAVCTAKMKFLIVILAFESSVHCQIEIFSCHFSVWEQCALSNWNFQWSVYPMRAVCTAKMKFLIVILPNRSSVQCKIKILTCHYSVWKQCAMSKLKFLAFIYPMRAVCAAKMKFLIVILPNKISVHCKIEFLVIILPHKSSVHCKIEISSHHFTP